MSERVSSNKSRPLAQNPSNNSNRPKFSQVARGASLCKQPSSQTLEPARDFNAKKRMETADKLAFKPDGAGQGGRPPRHRRKSPVSCVSRSTSYTDSTLCFSSFKISSHPCFEFLPLGLTLRVATPTVYCLAQILSIHVVLFSIARPFYRLHDHHPLLLLKL